MKIDAELLKILACPACKGALEHRSKPEEFHCGTCHRQYPIVDGIPNFLI